MKFISITENHLYQKVYARGKRYVTPTVVVYVLRDYAAVRLQKENPQKKKVNRIGLTTTKKLGNAVVRSRARRIMREAYRQMDRETPVQRGNLLVFVARDAATDAKMQDVLTDMRTAFRHLDLIKCCCTDSKGKE